MNKLFDEMKELIIKQNDEEFEFFIQNHQELLKEDPVLFISNHVSYYAISERVDKVLEVINYYKNAPYISMTVEDLLNELKEKVEKLKTSQKSLTKEEIITSLLSKNEEKIAFALEALSKLNIRSFIEEIQEFLLQEIPYKFKTLALFILIEQKYEDDIKVLKNGLIYTLSPNLLDLPFETYEYQETKRLIEEEDVDPQIKEYAVEIMNVCQIKEFPDSFITLDQKEFMKDIFIEMAKGYLLQECNLVNVAKTHKINIEKCQEIVKELEQIVKE